MARPASLDRLSRILAMVPWVIQHPEEATVEAVCERFGIDERTLTQDLSLLFMCGLPPFQPGDLIEAEIVGGHVVIGMADYLARPLRLTRWEAWSLLAAGRALAELPGLQEAPALSSALDKLASAIAPDEADAAAILAERVAIEVEPASPEILETLRGAIENRRTLSIEYYSFGRDALTARRIDPLLVFGSRPWYLVAHDHLSGERRTFRVDRIRALSETGETFARPEGFDPSGEAAAPLYHPSPDDETVVLEVSPAAAWVAELTPHERAQPAADGWVRLTLKTSSTAWLERLLVQQGSEIRVVEPQALRDRVRELAARTLRRYG